MPRPPPPGRLVSHRPSSARTASRRLFSRNISFRGKAMPAVHYYLGRPARVWISTHSPRSPARQARTGSGDAHSSIPGRPASGFTPSVPAAAHSSAGACSRRADNQKSPVTATSGLPPDAAPPAAACWPATGSQSPASASMWLPLAASAWPWLPDWTRPTTRSCPEAYPRPGNAPRSTWGYASDTRSYSRRK